MWEILLYIMIFGWGIFVGFLLKARLQRKAIGTIFVSHDEMKTLYSLELDEYPESIEFKKHVVFKVDTSLESLDRE